MAWTTPATWSVSEVVTAAKMNLHVRDNLTYLKGGAGTIAFDAGATFAASVAVSGTGGTLINASGSTTTTTINVTSPNVASQNAQFTLTNTGQRAATMYLDRATGNGSLRLALNTLALPLAAWEPANGWMGLMAVSAPRGMIHGYDTVSGLMKYEFDGVTGTAQTLILDGAGDVLYVAAALFVVRDSSGVTYQGTTTGIAPSGTYNLVADGSNTLQLQVAANGSVTVQRTLGSRTYKVSILLIWL
jgi:hypothetical protein